MVKASTGRFKRRRTSPEPDQPPQQPSEQHSQQQSDPPPTPACCVPGGQLDAPPTAGPADDEDDPPQQDQSPLSSLPFDVLLVVARHLAPRELCLARLAHSSFFHCAALICVTLTLTDDLAQHVLNDPTTQQLQQLTVKHLAGPLADLPPAFLQRLLARYPHLTALRIQCHARTLALVARSLLETASPREGPARVRDFARQLVDPWHAAVLHAAIVKHHVARGRVNEALEAVDVLERLPEPVRSAPESHALWRRGYESARTQLTQLCAEACRATQARLAGQAFSFAKKIAAQTAAARTWRWLLYFLVNQGHLNLTIEGIKTVHYGTLLTISPTCYDEVFRALFDAQIERGKHLDVLGSRPRGSWVNNLYHGQHSYSAKVLKDGALERQCITLVAKRHYSVVMTLVRTLDSDAIARELWAQLAASAGVLEGWECLLHSANIDQMLQLIPELGEPQRVDAYGDLLRLLVGKGLVGRALDVAALVADGACDTALWAAVRGTYRLDSPAVVARLSERTREVVRQTRALHHLSTAYQ